jgi:hypothetical protein
LLRGPRRAATTPPRAAWSIRAWTGCGTAAIYDHVGFGFHRYSTDERWLVPHFEKMLYDNAQLLCRLYVEAMAGARESPLRRASPRRRSSPTWSER